MAEKPYLKLAPYLTEKSLTLAGQNCYTFLVDKFINKSEIEKAIGLKFKVKVKKVNLQTRPERTVRRGRILGRRPAYKLAFVYLEKGQKIEGFEIKERKGPQQDEKPKSTQGS